MNFYPTFAHFDRYYKSILLQQERLKSQLNTNSLTESPYETFNNPRQWEPTEYGKLFSQIEPFMSNCTQISVASYNVLAQYLIKSNMHLYLKCEDEHLIWEYRQKNLLAEIKFLNCDIFCFQEIQADHYIAFYYPELTKLGYEGVFKKRTRDKMDGCATFFKSDKFKLETAKGLEYYRPGTGHLLDRDNVALITVLLVKGATSITGSANTQSDTQSQPASKFSAPPEVNRAAKIAELQSKQGTNLRVCVANTHLLFNPKRDDVKLSQMHLLMAEVDKLSRVPDNSSQGSHKQHVMPVIICGDFNLSPKNDIYQKFLIPRSKFATKDASTSAPSSASILPPVDIRLLLSRLRTDKWSRYLGTGHEVCPEGPDTKLELTLRHRFDLESVYDHYKAPHHDDGGPELNLLAPEVTTKNAMTSVTVDYMLFSSSYRGCQNINSAAAAGSSPADANNKVLRSSSTCHTTTMGAKIANLAFYRSPLSSLESSDTMNGGQGRDLTMKRKAVAPVNGLTGMIQDYQIVPCGDLRLLARYALLSEFDIANKFERADLPNAHFSSDHFSLAAKFLLCG